MTTTNTKYFRAKAFIFDVEGTMIDSTAAVKRHWHRFALENGLDENKILESSHDMRTVETMFKWTPHMATSDYALEFDKNLAEESEGVSAMPGISTLLQKIPSGKWGIYTSGSEYLTLKRLDQCYLPIPHSVICGDMVVKGKPDPEGYIQASNELGFNTDEVIVFEDSPSGVKAAHAAGATVIACETTHAANQLKKACADCVVKLLTDVDFTILPDGSFEVQVNNTL